MEPRNQLGKISLKWRGQWMCKAWYKDSGLGSAGRQLYRAVSVPPISPITALGNTVLVSGQRREILKGGSHLSPPSFSLFLLQTHWGFLVTWASPMNLQKNDPRKGPSWTECGKSKVEYMGITCDLVHVVEEALSFQFVLAASRMHQTRLLGPLLPPSMCWMVSIFWALWLSSDELVFPETCDPERIPHVLHYEWGEELRDKSRHRGMNIPIQREQR